MKPYVCTGPDRHQLKNNRGKCPYCRAPVVEATSELVAKEESIQGLPDPSTIKRYTAMSDSENFRRIVTGVGELDNILGGGFVPGEVVLFAGTPGAGKSTLLGIVAQSMSERDNHVLYFTGEESEQQVGSRHRRIGATSNNIDIVSSGKAVDVLSLLASKEYDFVVIDSIQTIKEKGMSMMDIAYEICGLAHSTGTPVVMVGHVTKEDKVGGPMTLTHAVDAVLVLSLFGDDGLRLLRSPKNRYANNDITSCFRHTENSFIEVPDPSGILDSREVDSIPGIGPTIIMEGTKPILAEVQSLVSEPLTPNIQFVVQGITYNKARIIVAALSKAGISPVAKDIFVNIGGGIKTADSGIDLAIAASIASAATWKKVNTRNAFLGEILLTGEVKPCSNFSVRSREAKKLGFTTIGPNCDINIKTMKQLARYILG